MSHFAAVCASIFCQSRNRKLTATECSNQKCLSSFRRATGSSGTVKESLRMRLRERVSSVPSPFSPQVPPCRALCRTTQAGARGRDSLLSTITGQPCLIFSQESTMTDGSLKASSVILRGSTLLISFVAKRRRSIWVSSASLFLVILF